MFSSIHFDRPSITKVVMSDSFHRVRRPTRSGLGSFPSEEKRWTVRVEHCSLFATYLTVNNLTLLITTSPFSLLPIHNLQLGRITVENSTDYSGQRLSDEMSFEILREV